MDEFEFQADPITDTELAALEHLELYIHQVFSAIFIKILLRLADN